MNNGFTTNTQLRKSADSMTTTTQGSRFSVSSIEFDLFYDMRASLRNSSPNVKQTVTREIQHKLPDGKKVKRKTPSDFSFLRINRLLSSKHSYLVSQED